MIPKNKKIAIIHPYVNKKGGAVNMMIYLSDILSNNNNVDFYTFKYDNNVFLNKNIVTFNNSKIISFLKIAYHIRQSDYIIIGNSPMQFVGIFSKIVFLSKAKILWWHHHYPWYYNGNANVFVKLKRIIEKFFIKYVNLHICNSVFIQNAIKDIYKIDSKILYPVLDNKFLDYARNYTEPNVEFKNLKCIFTFGRWVTGKNLDLVFKIYDNLKDKTRELVLRIGGVGNDLDFYKNKYKEDKRVIFLGLLNQEQIINNLEKSSLFIFPSKIDSFGLVIIESMSVGVPVVSYNIAGAKEIIQNGVNGFLVDSEQEFINRVYEILDNYDLRNKLSLESINTSKKFGKDTFIKNLSDIFDFIL